MGKKRALLVGINYPGTKYSLRGCVNDVKTINSIITSKFGFRERRMLTDNSATTDAIMTRLRWLVDGAQPGDVLYFHYSGHGSQMIQKDYLHDREPDGLDEIICPVDLDWRRRVIRDDDLKEVFSTVPEGVNLTVVLDCCHSGDAIDNVRNEVGHIKYQPIIKMHNREMLDSPNKIRLLEMPDDIAARAPEELSIRPRTLVKENCPNDGLLISGCRSNQTSADAWMHNRYMGACTFFLASNLAKYNYHMPYIGLVEKMNEDLSKYGYTQRPELNGASDKFTKIFLHPFI